MIQKKTELAPKKRIEVEEIIRNYDAGREPDGACEKLPELVRLAAKYGADVNVPTKNGSTLFHEACSFLDRMLALIDSSISMNVLNTCTALMEAGYDTTCERVREAGNENLPHPLQALSRHLLMPCGRQRERSFVDLVHPILEDSVRRLRDKKPGFADSSWIRDLFMGLPCEACASASASASDQYLPFDSIMHHAVQRLGDQEYKDGTQRFEQLEFLLRRSLSESDFAAVMNQKTELRDTRNPNRALPLYEAEALEPMSDDVKRYGGTLLHRALSAPCRTDRLIGVLLWSGLSPTEPDGLGRNALHLVQTGSEAQKILDAVLADGDLRRSTELLTGRDVNGRMPLEEMFHRYDKALNLDDDDIMTNVLDDLTAAISAVGGAIGSCLQKLRSERGDDRQDFAGVLMSQLNDLLTFAVRNNEPEMVNKALEAGADPAYVLFDDSRNGPYSAIRERTTDYGIFSCDVGILKSCIEALRERFVPDDVWDGTKPMRRFDPYNPACPDMEFLRENLHGCVLRQLELELTQKRDRALDELERLSAAGKKLTVSDWSRKVDEFPLIHHAAMTGRLPEGLFRDRSMAEIAAIKSPLLHGVAYTALRHGTLPPDFDAWDAREPGGEPLAHYAAAFGKLPERPELLEIRRPDGTTVLETVKLAASLGTVQEYWRDPPGLDPDENPHLVRDFGLSL